MGLYIKHIKNILFMQIYYVSFKVIPSHQNTVLLCFIQSTKHLLYSVYRIDFNAASSCVDSDASKRYSGSGKRIRVNNEKSPNASSGEYSACVAKLTGLLMKYWGVMMAVCNGAFSRCKNHELYRDNYVCFLRVDSREGRKKPNNILC